MLKNHKAACSVKTLMHQKHSTSRQGAQSCVDRLSSNLVSVFFKTLIDARVNVRDDEAGQESCTCKHICHTLKEYPSKKVYMYLQRIRNKDGSDKESKENMSIKIFFFTCKNKNAPDEQKTKTKTTKNIYRFVNASL